MFGVPYLIGRVSMGTSWFSQGYTMAECLRPVNVYLDLQWEIGVGLMVKQTQRSYVSDAPPYTSLFVAAR